jgi:hypothetical protein
MYMRQVALWDEEEREKAVSERTETARTIIDEGRLSILFSKERSQKKWRRAVAEIITE